MKNPTTVIAIVAMALCLTTGGCSHKGSSSVSSRKHTTTSRTAPKVRPVATETAADRAARIEAEKEAEAQARREAEEAKAAALKAKQEAERKAKEEAEKAVVVKEEKVKVIESNAKTDENCRYHIIIGSFKVLQNARQICQDAIAKDFLPSIMENEEGMYRVGVYSSATEKTAREKIAALRKSHPEYVGMWLLVEKK